MEGGVPLIYLLLFLEGILTFISPCILPMLPLYFSYIGATSTNRKANLANTLLFISGFSVVFITLSVMVNTFSRLLIQNRSLINLISGGLIILIGLDVLLGNKLGAKLFKPLSLSLDRSKAFFVGVLFAISWTPCVGAYLASVISLSLNATHLLGSILMLAVYCLGLAVPFILSSLLLEQVIELMRQHSRVFQLSNKLAAVLMIIVGILLATNLLTTWIGV